jgi:hypothetical protein
MNEREKTRNDTNYVRRARPFGSNGQTGQNIGRLGSLDLLPQSTCIFSSVSVDPSAPAVPTAPSASA